MSVPVQVFVGNGMLRAPNRTAAFREGFSVSVEPLWIAFADEPTASPPCAEQPLAATRYGRDEKESTHVPTSENESATRTENKGKADSRLIPSTRSPL